MNHACSAALVVLILGSISKRSEAMPPRWDDQPKTAEATADDAAMLAKFAAIKAEYDAEMTRCQQATEQVQDQAEVSKIYRKMAPDDVVYSRRMVELALTAPRTTGARDALLWVIDHPGRQETGPFGDEFARAAALLVRHHGDDPEAVRIGLRIDNLASPQRDVLLYGFLAAAKSRESKGLARLSLAQYLETKAKFAQGTRDIKSRPKFKIQAFVGEDGKVGPKEIDQPIENYAYILALRESVPDSLKYEAERLYEEVIAEYSEIPHITVVNRRLEALMKEPNPTSNGKPLTEAERRQLAEIVARKKTLGEVAKARLDAMQNLVVGKPAPEIVGVDFQGKPLKLSDYRGKVVALVFWGTWCGPCMAEVPRERALVEKLKDKPFAMLGINCDYEKSAAIKVMETEKITWPNWFDGAPDSGPITRLYHIRGYPTVIVVDAQGIIRHKDLRGESIDKAVEQLLENLTAKENTKP